MRVVSKTRPKRLGSGIQDVKMTASFTVARKKPEQLDQPWDRLSMIQTLQSPLGYSVTCGVIVKTPIIPLKEGGRIERAFTFWRSAGVRPLLYVYISRHHVVRFVHFRADSSPLSKHHLPQRIHRPRSGSRLAAVMGTALGICLGTQRQLHEHLELYVLHAGGILAGSSFS